MPTTTPSTRTPSNTDIGDDLKARSARFAPVDLTADTSALWSDHREVLRPLIEASQVIDAFYLRQVRAGNESLLQSLAKSAAQGDPVASCQAIGDQGSGISGIREIARAGIWNPRFGIRWARAHSRVFDPLAGCKCFDGEDNG